MPNKFDFQKEWFKAKGNLNKFSKDFSTLAKKGEKEVVRLSALGKLQVDSTAMVIKKEHIFHLIGKEYVKMKCPGEKSAKMKELLSDLRHANVEHRKARVAIQSMKH